MSLNLKSQFQYFLTHFLLILLTASSSHSICFAQSPLLDKPIEVFPQNQHAEQELSLSSDQIKNQMACHVQRFLGPYSHYIEQNIFPRLVQEFSQLITPQISTTGNLIQSAEAIDATDLFHAHIRVPLSAYQTLGDSQLAEIFMDDQIYFLQYHSFERPSLYLEKWLSEISFVPNPDIQAWVQAVKAYNENQESHGNFGFGLSEQAQERLHAASLNEEQLKVFVDLWYQFSHQGAENIPYPTGWIKKRLEEKLRLLDPSDYPQGESITLYRNIKSVTERFIALKSDLTQDSFAQVADIYFMPRESNTPIEAVIQRAQAQGFSFIINSQNIYVKSAGFREQTPWQAHTLLFNQLVDAARSYKDLNNVFNHAYRSAASARNHTYISWSDQYIFSVRYSLNCEEN